MTWNARADGLRRSMARPARMGFAAALVVALLVSGLVVFLACGGDDGDSSSRFSSIHTFDSDDYHALTFAPTRDGVVVFGHHHGLQMSEDSGESWSELVAQPNWDAMNLVYDPFSPETLYAAGHEVFYRSEDGGGTWSEVDSDLPGLDLHAFGASPTSEGRLYAFAVGHGLYVSEGGFESWGLLWGDAPQGTNSILELPDGTLLLAATDLGILRSQDGGKTWRESRAGMEIGAIFTVKGDPNGQRQYAGTSEGVFVSTDRGKSWSATALNDTVVYVIGVHPSDPMELLAIDADGRLFRSRDGGLSWG